MEAVKRSARRRGRRRLNGWVALLATERGPRLQAACGPAPWSVAVIGDRSPAADAAGYWIPARWEFEVAREAAERDPGVNSPRITAQ